MIEQTTARVKSELENEMTNRKEPAISGLF